MKWTTTKQCLRTQQSYFTHELTAVWLPAQDPHNFVPVSFPIWIGWNHEAPCLAKSYWQLKLLKEGEIVFFGGVISDMYPSIRGRPYTHEPMIPEVPTGISKWLREKEGEEEDKGTEEEEETMNLSGASWSSLGEVEGWVWSNIVYMYKTQNTYIEIK